jgi:hypothetical protein
MMKDDIVSKPLVGEHARMAPFNQGLATGLALAADSAVHEIEQIEYEIGQRLDAIRQEQEQEEPL